MSNVKKRSNILNKSAYFTEAKTARFNQNIKLDETAEQAR